MRGWLTTKAITNNKNSCRWLSVANGRGWFKRQGLFKKSPCLWESPRLWSLVVTPVVYTSDVYSLSSIGSTLIISFDGSKLHTPTFTSEHRRFASPPPVPPVRSFLKLSTQPWASLSRSSLCVLFQTHTHRNNFLRSRWKSILQGTQNNHVVRSPSNTKVQGTQNKYFFLSNR